MKKKLYPGQITVENMVARLRGKRLSRAKLAQYRKENPDEPNVKTVAVYKIDLSQEKHGFDFNMDVEIAHNGHEWVYSFITGHGMSGNEYSARDLVSVMRDYYKDAKKDEENRAAQAEYDAQYDESKHYQVTEAANDNKLKTLIREHVQEAINDVVPKGRYDNPFDGERIGTSERVKDRLQDALMQSAKKFFSELFFEDYHSPDERRHARRAAEAAEFALEELLVDAMASYRVPLPESDGTGESKMESLIKTEVKKIVWETSPKGEGPKSASPAAEKKRKRALKKHTKELTKKKEERKKKKEEKEGLKESKKYPDTAEEYAHQLNRESESRRGPDDWGGVLTTDPDHWAEMGIHTGEDLARGLAADEYSDTYKDIYGIRPKIKWRHLSVEELEARVDALLRSYADEDDEEDYY
jgi:hypothetical protein